MAQDWVKWHERYDNPKSSMPRRLDAVQERLAQALGSVDVDQPRIVSLSGGEGRDVIPVLQRHPKGRSCRAALIELSPVLAARAEAAADAGDLEVLVRVADAGDTACYATDIPADVLLLCGIFGNVPDLDIQTTIASAGGLVRRGGWVIWTRHRRTPDLTPQIRDWFTDAGFGEVGFDSPGSDSWSVGTCLNNRAPEQRAPGRLFSFTS